MFKTLSCYLSAELGRLLLVHSESYQLLLCEVVDTQK